MTDLPEFSLLLPVYAGDRADHLERAFVSSVHGQSLRPSEVVMVQDGPVGPELEERIAVLVAGSPVPVRHVRIERNVGLAVALTEGLAACRHDVVARMDADDISLPQRFAVQIPLIAQGHDLVGSGMYEFTEDETGRETLGATRNPPTSSADISRYARFHDPFNHPTVVYTKAAVERADVQTPAEVRSQLWHLFSARLVPVADYYTPGNVLVRDVLRAAPPGALIRAMGIQNIKGTGLDFVYRWQAWDHHATQLRALAGSGTDAVVAAAQALAASTELGVLEAETLRTAIARLSQVGLGQTDILQSLVARIERNLESNLQQVDAHRQSTPEEGNRAWRWILRTTEQLLDAGDAVRRRRTANQVYADLVAGRVSSARAAYELKHLNQRQKGGWLSG